MQTQVGERYRCSDPDCGCEIEITAAGNSRDDVLMGDSNLDSDRSIGGSATGETGAGSLRDAETGGISTPGDFGSQGATGEGIFGTSGGGQRSTMSGRLGSSTASLRSGRTGTPASGADSNVSGSRDESSFGGSDDDQSVSALGEEDDGFFCQCGEPMVKSSSTNQNTRAARA